MTEYGYGLAFLALFSLSALGGMALRRRLPKEHLSDDNMEAVRLVTGLLVTFAALVLSLQLSSARSTLEAAARDRTTFAGQLASFDRCLRTLGTPLAQSRLALRRYTAAVIASTWPDEPAPIMEGGPDASRMPLRGEDPALSALIRDLGIAVDAFVPAEPALANRSARCRAEYGALTQARAAVIEDVYAPSGAAFVGVVAFWLSLVFLSFGLQMPRRRLSAVVLGIGVVAVSSVMFVIIDLSLPYGGMFGISSEAMRAALADMMR